MSEISLQGRVAVVTGAGNGLGRAYARELARRGAAVVVNDLGGDTRGQGQDDTVAQAVVAEIEDAGGQAVAHVGDVADQAAMEKLIARAVDSFGRIDIVINNAGAAGAEAVGDHEAWERTVAINLYGCVHTMRAAWPHFVAQNYGRIVNTSSSSVLGTPRAGAYAAAKGGVLALTRTMASTYTDLDIRINAIMPIAGTRLFDQVDDTVYREWMKTHFKPEQVAAFLPVLCDESVPVNGETFTVGGGRAARVLMETTDGWFNPDATAEEFRSQWSSVMSDAGRRVATSGQGDLVRYADLLGDRGPF